MKKQDEKIIKSIKFKRCDLDLIQAEAERRGIPFGTLVRMIVKEWMIKYLGA